ncbi:MULTISPECIES: hypothetical protein [unclassified Microcoleus]|uniref:hypothetical protein n=1 Tax=unclassified Microcoleus TaxID=2642155 RepID=UPI002FCE7878
MCKCFVLKGNIPGSRSAIGAAFELYIIYNGMWSKPARCLPGLKRCDMRHGQDAISLRMSVEDIKIYPAVLYSSKSTLL